MVLTVCSFYEYNLDTLIAWRPSFAFPITVKWGSPIKTFRQIGQGVPELWSDTQLNKKTNKLRILFIYTEGTWAEEIESLPKTPIF